MIGLDYAPHKRCSRIACGRTCRRWPRCGEGVVFYDPLGRCRRQVGICTGGHDERISVSVQVANLATWSAEESPSWGGLS
jgi:hypothetical protein